MTVTNETLLEFGRIDQDIPQMSQKFAPHFVWNVVTWKDLVNSTQDWAESPFGI
jgi:hypothetical protein